MFAHTAGRRLTGGTRYKLFIMKRAPDTARFCAIGCVLSMNHQALWACEVCVDAKLPQEIHNFTNEGFPVHARL